MLEKQMRKKRTNALLSVSLLLSASWSGAALGNTAAYSIWYKVQVESCAADVRGKRRVIEFDPRIDNRGRG